jgi:hypothetical protein
MIPEKARLVKQASTSARAFKQQMCEHTQQKVL